MQNQSKAPKQDKSKSSPGSQQQGNTSRRGQGQDANRKTGKDNKNVLVNEEEQNQATDTSSPGTLYKQGTGKEKERSFYKHDLPETEEGTDVEEKSSNLRS